MGQVPFLFPGGNPANVARMFGRDFSQNKSESVWPWVVGGVLVLGLGATTVLLVRAKKKKRRKALAAKTKATKRRKALAAKTKATK